MVRARAKFGLVMAIALTATACGGGDGGGGGGAGSEDQLKIGVINPASGPNSAGGEAIFQGYKIAAQQANADGGVLGREVVLVRSDATTPEQGISEVNRLATKEEVDLFAGTYISGIANTASETALRYGKLYWDTNATAGDLTERGLDNFARSGPMAEQFAQVAADAAEGLLPEAVGKPVDQLRVCVTHEESSYGTSISERVVENLEGLGAEVTSTIAYSPTSPSLANVVVECQNGNPDIWVETGYVSDINLLLRTANQQGFNPDATMLIGTGDTDLTLDAVGAETLDGTFVVGYPHFDIQPSYAPGAAEFLETYKEQYDSEPTFPQTLTAYTGMQMLFEALNEAESTEPDAVMEVISGWDKPLGTSAAGYGAQFDENHQNVKALPTVVQWQAGETVTVHPQEAALPESKILGSSE